MRLKKILAILLTAVLLVSSTVIALPVSAGGDTTSAWDGTVVKPGENGLDLSTVLEGSGTEADPYLISSASDLANVAGASNNYNQDTTTKSAANAAHYKLTADIDLGNQEWFGIGDPWGASFSGTFDGDGHVIINLKLASNQATNGLFRITTNGAVIKNVGIASGASVVSSGSTVLGNLVGNSNGTLTVSNCFNAASLTVNITSGTSHIGGLVGITRGNTTFEDCWNTGDVTVKCSTSTNVGVGGIAGTIGVNASTTEFSVTDCHSICDIKVDFAAAWDGIGVLFGKGVVTSSGSWSVENCSAKGTVTVTNAATSSEYTGLFVGYTEGNHTWTSCTYSVTGTKNNATLDKVVAAGSTEGITKVDSVAITATSLLVGNYAQNGEVGENRSNSVRFVSELAFSTAAFQKTGYKVNVTYNSTEADKMLEGVVVYTSLNAGEGTVTPENGKYFIAYGISDIPVDADATFEVTPYVVTLDGDYIYGSTATFEMSNGDIPEV